MHANCRFLLLGATVLAASVAGAAQGSGSDREAFYRCKDASGQTHYGDSMPQRCTGQDTEVLNDRGMVVRIIEGESSREARLKREASESSARREREQRAQRDRMLIDTYLSVADIERLRDQRLDLLVAQYKMTEQNIASLRERQLRLENQIARFKPYSQNPNAPALPDHLAEEMVNTANSMRTYQEMLTRNHREQSQLKASFDVDIRRFKELKGLK
jgi:hypothetical protein